MDELYVIARRVLLDALEALGPHRHATILVGAQAIYLHTGAADLAVAEYTTDADLAIDPELLKEFPPLEQALTDAGFFPTGSDSVGVWKTTHTSEQADNVEVQVDLLVPNSVSPGTGRRAARLPGHDVKAARKVAGLEGVLVDKVEMDIGSLEPSVDERCIKATVAGPGALMVAKLFKLNERKGTPRANDKDALDVLRILRAIETADLAKGMHRIFGDERSKQTAQRGVVLLEDLFGTRGSEGAVMAARAAFPLVDEDEIRRSCEILAHDLLKELKS